MKSFRFKRTQRKYKTPYTISNWKTYEVGLRQRGSVTIWVTKDAVRGWCHRGRRKRGGKRVYSDAAIETLWTISMVYSLPLRQTEGFIESPFHLGPSVMRCQITAPSRATFEDSARCQ